VRATPSQTLPRAGARVRGPPARIRNGIKKVALEDAHQEIKDRRIIVYDKYFR